MKKTCFYVNKCKLWKYKGKLQESKEKLILEKNKKYYAKMIAKKIKKKY